MDDPGRVRSQIINVVCQIQRFDFDCILVLSRKVIIRIPPVLGLKPLYVYCEMVGAKQAAQANLVRAAEAELVAKQVELREDGLRKVRRKQAVGSSHSRSKYPSGVIFYEI